MRITILELWAREAMLNYASNLAVSLAPQAEVCLVVPKGTDINFPLKSVQVEQVEVVRDASVRELLKAPYYLFKGPSYLHKVLRTRPSILHINNAHVWHLLTLPFLVRKLPIVATLHDVYPHEGSDNTLRKRLEIAFLARHARHVFVHGEKLRLEVLKRYSKPPDSVSSIPLCSLTSPGITPPTGESLERSSSCLFFGRIRAYKGLEYFLSAAQRLSSAFPACKFTVAGSGDLKPYANTISKVRNIEIVNRYISEGEIPKLFSSHSLVILPYTEASQSGIIPLAFAYGCAVVAADVGSIGEVVKQGETGLLFPPGDMEALVSAISSLLNDDYRRKILVKNARDIFEKSMNWAVLREETFRIYRKVLDAHQK